MLAPGHGKMPPAALVRPAGFQIIPPENVAQRRVNLVQALSGYPALLDHIRRFGTVTPASVGNPLLGPPPMAP
eukprot:14410869-Alexandrium_andersonii.AAC.1